jgi:hypothetical protein
MKPTIETGALLAHETRSPTAGFDDRAVSDPTIFKEFRGKIVSIRTQESDIDTQIAQTPRQVVNHVLGTADPTGVDEVPGNQDAHRPADLSWTSRDVSCCSENEAMKTCEAQPVPSSRVKRVFML